MSVRLSDFVAEAISEIAHGIHAAKAETYDFVAVVPGSMNGKGVLERSYIEFDIAITAVSESTSGSSKLGKAGAGISVLSAKVGLDGNLSIEKGSKDSTGLTSRVSFKVPIYFNAHFRGDANAADEAAFIKGKIAARSKDGN